MVDADICRLLILGDTTAAEGLFLQQAINVNAKLPCGLRPLTLALKLRSAETIAMLLALGADVELPDKIGGSSILYDAYWHSSEYEEPADLGLLLDGGLPIDRLDTKGMSLLMHAAASYVWTTKFLLERGADPNLRDRDGWTAIMFAAQTDWHGPRLNRDSIAEVVRLLIKAGADLSLRNMKGERAADILARQTPTSKTVEVMNLLGAA
jgi:ankyrin repeat protein